MTQESLPKSGAQLIKNELLLQELVGRMAEYMKQHSLSFIKLHEEMDNNKDNHISGKVRYAFILFSYLFFLLFFFLSLPTTVIFAAEVYFDSWYIYI